MPAVDVAPIYSDAWTKQHYEGMARLILAVPDTADKTIGGVTCRLYCVRFFYVVINHRRWVDVADITTWQDTEDRYVPFAIHSGNLPYIDHNTVLRHPATQPAGISVTGYFSCPALAVNEVILGIGISFAIQPTVHADSYVYIQLRLHGETDPTDGSTVLKTALTYDQAANYAIFYAALPSPHEIESGESYEFRITLFAKEVEEDDGYVYAKAPFVRLERTI